MLVVFMQKGAGQAATSFKIGDSNAFNGVITGIFFLLIIASEFFVNYKVIFKGKGEKNRVSNKKAEVTK